MYDWNANGIKPQVKMDAPESQWLYILVENLFYH